MIPTCQICGREIKTVNGRIAHHGYKRPYGMHYQTRSCFGARYVPYETGHDALDAYEPMLMEWLHQAQHQFSGWMSNPPDTIVFQRRDAWNHKIGEPLTLTRPEGFSAKQNLAAGSYRPRTYESEHAYAARNHQNNISGLTDDLKYVKARRAAWRTAA